MALNFKKLPIDDSALWFDVYTAGILVGSFKCKFWNTNSNSFKVEAMRRNQRTAPKDKNRLEYPKTGEDFDFIHRRNVDFLLSQDVLVDWKVEDSEGNAIPFTVENATEFFCHPDYLYVFNKIRDDCQSEDNYRVDSSEKIMGESTPGLE